MSEPIKPGDLVMVVRWPHEHGLKMLGTVWTVYGLRNDCPRCYHCNTNIEPEQACAEIKGHHNRFGIPLSWLKKIDPPALPQDVKRDEEITA